MIKLPKFNNPLRRNKDVSDTSTVQSSNKIKQVYTKSVTILSPKLSFLKSKLITLWVIIKLKTSRRLVYAIILILITIYVSMYVTLGYQILTVNRQDRFAKSAIKVFPIPVAYVGNNFIFAGDYFARVSLLDSYRKSSSQPEPTDTAKYRDDIMDKVIFTETLRQLSYKNKVRLTPKEIDAEYEKIISTLPDASKAPEEIKNLYGLSVPQFKKFVAEIAIENKLLSEKLVSYHISHIMVTDENTANTVLEKAKASEDWTGLVTKYSEDKFTRDSAGDLGFVDHDTANQSLGKDFEDTAFGITEPEKVADKVAKSPYGFHIIKLLEKKGEINMGLIDWVNDYKSKIKVINYFHSAESSKTKIINLFKKN